MTRDDTADRGIGAKVKMTLAAAGLVAALAALPGSASAQNNTAAGAVIGGTAGALIGGAVTGTGGGVAAGAIIGGTTGALIGSQQQNRRAYFFWGNDGRCYLRQTNGAVVRVSRGNCG